MSGRNKKKSIVPILLLCYEESLVSSNLNSNLLRSHWAHPNELSRFAFKEALGNKKNADDVRQIIYNALSFYKSKTILAGSKLFWSLGNSFCLDHTFFGHCSNRENPVVNRLLFFGD